MSWLARSLANSLRIDNEEEHLGEDFASSGSLAHNLDSMERSQDGYGLERIGEDREATVTDEANGRGVKEDLTEFKQALSRQLWGVANFLAPPSSVDGDQFVSRDGDRPVTNDSSSSVGYEEEFVSNGMNHPDALQDDGEGFDEGASASDNEGADGGIGGVGVTEEVLAFAKNIALHPETWLDFPLEEDNIEEFDLSDAQRQHAFAIEQFAPRLAALRIELCPCHMTESYFWMVYFVLLHSRLSKHDSELLYTPQIMEARSMWMRELHKQTRPESVGTTNFFTKDRSLDVSDGFDEQPEKRSVGCSSDAHFIDKSVINEKLLPGGENKEILRKVAEIDDDDGWLEEDSDLGSCYKASFSVGNADEISFSDLEDDGCTTAPPPPK